MSDKCSVCSSELHGGSAHWKENMEKRDRAIANAEKSFQSILNIHPPRKYGSGSDDHQAVEDMALIAEKAIAELRRVSGKI